VLIPFLKYNPRLIYRHPEIYEFSKTGSFNSMVRHWRDTYYERETPHMAYDRSGTIPHHFEITGVDRFPDASGFKTRFRDVVGARCQELLNTGRRLNVMWSGGIDSTCMLFALMSVARSQDLLRRIRVICNYNSVLEGGTLFDSLIRDKVAYILEPTGLRGKLYEPPIDDGRSLYVTGGLGDQLFGRNDHIINYSKEDLERPWRQMSAGHQIFLTPAIEASPRPIKTFYDYLWYYSFNFAWQSVKWHHHFMIPSRLHPRILNFYGTEDFQRWSIANDEPAMPGGIETYKWPARELILELTGDREYVAKKPKLTSQHAYSKLNWLALTSGGGTLYVRDLDENPQVILTQE